MPCVGRGPGLHETPIDPGAPLYSKEDRATFAHAEAHGMARVESAVNSIGTAAPVVLRHCQRAWFLCTGRPITRGQTGCAFACALVLYGYSCPCLAFGAVELWAWVA